VIGPAHPQVLRLQYEVKDMNEVVKKLQAIDKDFRSEKRLAYFELRSSSSSRGPETLLLDVQLARRIS